MITVGKKSKINVTWKVSPYDYSKEKLNSLISKISKKYNIGRENIKIIPEFQVLDDKGNNIGLTNDIITNIQDPQFQLTLFKEYLSVNNITNYDFDIIKRIDSEINQNINYSLYDKYNRYSIKWVKWDNFLSYGGNNFFDFTQLNGLCLLNGEPANQSGKTTFAIDLIHFLLFGKTDKSSIQEKIFNKHLTDATEVCVEGCLTINNEDYVIKRKLVRPSLSKRTSKSKTTQKVEYYKIVGESLETLEDFIDNQQEENGIKTNKVIKESIGNEDDFDMIICATSSNLDELIEKKDAERGRLLSRWIGLLPIEQKDILARQKFNSEIKPYLISPRYNIESLELEIKALKANNKTISQEINKYSLENNEIDELLITLEKTKESLLSSMSSVDSSLLKVDINTLNNQINTILENGKKHKFELEKINDEIKEIGDVEFSINDYDDLVEKINNINITLSVKRQEYERLANDIKVLQKSEYCPTCGRKYDNIDNSEKIKEYQDNMNEIIKNGNELKIVLSELNKTLEEMKKNRQLYDEKSKLQIKKSTIELKVEQLRSEYKDKNLILVEYNKNNEAIDRNNKLEIEIRNIDSNIKSKRTTKETNIRYIESFKQNIENNESHIEDRIKTIDDIKKEEIMLRHWKIYLDMIGKDGISKMVLRKTLPIINSQVSALLNDVCDFDIEINMNNKNDILFQLVKDGVKSDLTSGSGFEKTASALALRCVLGNISTLPRCNGIILDEIWGRVAKDNYDNMKKVLDRITSYYDYVLIISHLDEIKDYCSKIITVRKENNISSIQISK
ncbi:MAG: hypothetical protein IKT40_09065 [Bacilli bacterium]|nr:hypothetical protein [Bacilli bacterium]